MMPNQDHTDDLKLKVKSDPEFAWEYVQKLQQEAETTVKAKRERIAKAIFDLIEADITEVEELDKECPEDEPVTYCVHDLRALLFNVLYEVMHRKLGFHIQRVDNIDHLVPGALFANKENGS